MSLKRRISKLEEAARETARQANPDMKLFDSLGREAEGEIMQMPTIDNDGVALLADGTQQSILFEENWKDQPAVHSYGLREDEAEEQLRIRRADILRIVHKYV